MDILLYIITGAGVGLIIGMTGVGGGSLMTPILLAFGFPMPIAVGTDLLYGGLTKVAGSLSYARLSYNKLPHSKLSTHQEETINWQLVRHLALGSLPASLGTVALLHFCFTSSAGYSPILTTCLGIMLMVSSLAIFLRTRLQGAPRAQCLMARLHPHRQVWTVLAGAFLGVMVTLSSVGAGALGITFLVLLYPRMRGTQVVATDIVHAVPLTLVAGIGHLLLGNVDYQLLAYLLIGSLPGIWFSARLSVKLPDGIIRSGLAILLLGIGIRYTFF